MKKNIIIAVLTVLLAGLLFGVTNVSAEELEMDTRMTISPPKQRIVLVPGESFEGVIRVSNSADAKKNLKYSVTIGSLNLGKDENGNIDYNDIDTDTITGYNQIMQWIVLGKEKGEVAPNTTDTIPFTINVPMDAPAGGQYATIIVQNDSDEDAAVEGNVVIQNILRFASSIYAEVTGETREDGAILENNIPSFLLSSPLEASSVVRNNGNVHADASYTLQVWPLFSDEEICTNEEEPTTSLVMPETERYHAESCNLPAFGIFRAKQIVKVFGETSEVEKTIFICPIWLLFIIIFVIVSIIIWLFMKAKDRKK